MAKVLIIILQIALYVYVRLMQVVNHIVRLFEIFYTALLWPIRRLRD